MKTRETFNSSYVLNLLGAGAFLVLILWLISKLFADGLYPLATVLGAIAVFVAMVYLRPRLTAYRWMAVGIGLAFLFTIYPIFYTIYLSFTNMGSGHLMTKEQAVSRLEAQQYLPENGETFKWAAYRNLDNKYALWLQSSDGQGKLAIAGEPLQTLTPGEGIVGDLDEAGFPTRLEGYQRLARKDIVPIIKELSALEFGAPPQTVRIRSLGEAVASAPLYKYDESQNVIISQKTGEEFKAINGTFTSAAGEELTPGYIVSIGIQHFTDFLGNKGYREPLGKILLWNISFTFLSVFFSFAVGLIATVMFDDLPGKRIIRSLLIIPWPIPVLISILIWRNMLHPNLGYFAPILESLFGSSPAWFQDVFWTRFALVMINVWLSYPYFYVITAGAVRAIPEEIYSAALVDGANAWQKFYYITLPLLLRILTPLLIASLTFNFNNFNVIYVFNYGYPAMAGTAVPMGQTDILISIIYRLAFLASNVPDYGLAATISVVLFLLITSVVVIQMRYTNMFKEVE
jgi:arabinogalactan oligomer / maltooligosaccharide transport system permease protein